MRLSSPAHRGAALAVAVGALWLAFYAAWLALRPWGDRGVLVFVDTAYLVPVATATLAALFAARYGARGQRPFWTLLAVSNGIWLAAELLWSIRELSEGSVPFPWWTDFGYITSFLVLPFALFAAFRPTMRTISPARILDAVLLVGLLSFAWWWLVLRPVPLALDRASLVGLAYPLIGLVLLAILATMRVLPVRRGSLSLRLVGLAVLTTAVTDGTYTAAAVSHDYLPGNWISLGWQAEAVLMTVAGVIASSRVESTAGWMRFRHERDVAPALLATVALAATFALLVGASVYGDASTVLYVGASAIAATALARLWLLVLGERRTSEAIDPATGTYDAGYHDERLTRLLARARAFDEPFALALIATDEDYGDAEEIAIAGRIADTVSDIESVSRVARDRLAVLMPAATPKEARAALDRLRLIASGYPSEGGARSTVSIGFAIASREDDAVSLGGRAAAALAGARESGGNQVRDTLDQRVLFASRALTPEVFDSLDALVRLADEREGPEGHARAVATLCRRLALQLGLDEAAAERLYLAGLLHDVGKISVPDAVLAKRSELTATEWAQVKRHARLGAALAARMPAVADAAPAIEAHHERWDGSGYPRRLRGEQIPLEGRILGVADSYVAMLSERPFREQRSRGSALTSLWREAAILYDPNVVAALLLIAGQSDVELETLAAHALD